MGCGVSKMTSEGSTEYRGFEGTATVIEVQRQAQQCSVGWLTSGDSIIKSSSAASDGLQI